MTPIDFSEFSITPAALERYRTLAVKTALDLAASGVRVRPGEEQAYLLADGRILITVDIQQGMSLNSYIEPHEWHRTANN